MHTLMRNELPHYPIRSHNMDYHICGDADNNLIYAVVEKVDTINRDSNMRRETNTLYVI